LIIITDRFKKYPVIKIHSDFKIEKFFNASTQVYLKSLSTHLS
jgi:hypothetical protein